MPRQRPARPAPARPSAAPMKPAPQAQQARPSSTATAPTPPAQQQYHSPHAQQQPPPAVQSSQGPGLFGQMASTAAGVAVGSSIGHAVGSLFTGGGSSSAPTEAQPAPATQAQPMDSGLYQSSTVSNGWETPGCENNVLSFRQCMDDHQGNLSICGWYLDQLKACQAAAKQY